MLFRALAASLLLVSIGCAARPIQLKEPPPSGAAPDSSGMADIVVMRTGVFAFAVTFGVYINDLHVGELHTDDYVRHSVPPGRVKMFVGSENRSEASFPVEANRAYYFRAIPTMGWWIARVQLEVMDPAEGSATVQNLNNKTFDVPEPFPFDLTIEPGES